MRRIQARGVVDLPVFVPPNTVRKRKRRQQIEPFRDRLTGISRFVLSPRWISLGLLAVTVYALMLIATDPRYFLTYIPVEGAVAVQPDTIVATSGLAGQHIFAANPSDAAVAIDTLPGIISSTVSLRWPNEVYVHVGEESPVALWVEDGVQYGVTEGGRLIEANFSQRGMVQIFSLLKKSPPDNNTVEQFTPAEDFRSSGDDQAAAEGATTPATDTVLAFIPPALLQGALQLRRERPEIEQLFYEPGGGLSYDDARGWRAYLGDGTDIQQKLAVYETIVTQVTSAGVQPSAINVSNQEKPFYAMAPES